MTKKTITITKPRIRPRGNWVLVQPDPDLKENEFGLTVPDSVEKEKKAFGVIIDVGPLVEDLKKGQRVMYGMYAGEPINMSHGHFDKEKVDYILVLSDDILAILE